MTDLLLDMADALEDMRWEAAPEPTRAYLAGPMSGIPGYNFPAFRAAAEDLREQGFDVLSPVEMDEEDGLDPAALLDDSLSLDQYKDLLSRDIDRIVKDGIEVIVVLPGWEGSGGANVEVAFGRAAGLPILSYPDLYNVRDTPAVPRVKGEVRITDPDTGGAKGQKPERLELIPAEFLNALARVYGMGADKYSDYNYLQGYSWNLSLGALLRHVNEWRNGETLDAESGEHHLAHAAWHCATLFMFETHGLGHDDTVFAFLDGSVDHEGRPTS